eukprot:gene22058-biopygen7750
MVNTKLFHRMTPEGKFNSENEAKNWAYSVHVDCVHHRAHRRSSPEWSVYVCVHVGYSRWLVKHSLRGVGQSTRLPCFEQRILIA